MAAYSCAFWDCHEPLRADDVVCRDHYAGYATGDFDECPGCGRLKDAGYDVCLECFNGVVARHAGPWQSPFNVPGNIRDAVREPGLPEHARAARRAGVRERVSRYEIERSDAWDYGDRGVKVFYTYILKLNDGAFYAGHTRELRPRLMEHRDGANKATARRDPKLVWFAPMRTRQKAARYEAELKELIDRNPREFRKMMIDFGDLVRSVDLEA